LKVHCDSELGLRADVEVDGVRDGKTLVGDGDATVAAEGDVLESFSLNQAGAGARRVGWTGDAAVEEGCYDRRIG